MKSLRLLLVLAFVFVGLGFSHNVAQAGAFTYTSSINLQNLENTTASITIHFYNQDGTENVSPVTDTIGPLGSKVYFPIPASTGFNGSVVIESSTQIGSVSNIHGNNFAANASYVGSNTGSTTVLIPLLMKGNSGYNTWFNVQNTGSADANVQVAYSDGTSATGTIKPGAAKTFDQSSRPAIRRYSRVLLRVQMLSPLL